MHTSLTLDERSALFNLRLAHRTEVACARIASLFGRRDGGTKAAHVVARIRDELGGDSATSRIPESYPGTCAMFYSGRSGPHCAVFPNYGEAVIAAGMAINPTIGGFSPTVEVAWA